MINKSFDSRTFRAALGTFVTGITVVAVNNNASVHAMTANAITSVSLDPPLILLCVNNRAKSLRMIHDAGAFSVNVLRREQLPLSRYFSNQSLEHLPNFNFSSANTVSPVLDNALASLDCTVENEINAGDHTIFLARVINIFTADGDPLCFFKGNYVFLETVEQ